MKRVVMSFPARVSQDYSGIHADRRAFLAWDWSGDEGMEAVLELGRYVPGSTGYPVGRVRYTPEDAAALLPTLRLAERIFVADYEAMERDRAARQAAKRFLPRLPPVQPAPREQVPPSLRFMLEPEARAEAVAFCKLLRVQRGDGYLRLADSLPSRFPLIARADALVGGALSRCIRLTSEATQPVGQTMPVLSPAIALENGHPEILAESVARAERDTLSKYCKGKAHAYDEEDCPF